MGSPADIDRIVVGGVCQRSSEKLYRAGGNAGVQRMLAEQLSSVDPSRRQDTGAVVQGLAGGVMKSMSESGALHAMVGDVISQLGSSGELQVPL